jgi:hypothetical protein
MKLHVRLLVVASIALPLGGVGAAVAGCGSDDSSPSEGVDAGPALPDGASPGSDSGPGGTDSGPEDAGQDATDAGTDATAPLTTCDPLQRVDTLRGVTGSVGAAGFGDAWAVTWFQSAAVSPDAQLHWKARVFDGAALAAEQDLGVDVSVTQSPLVSDGAGHAFAQRFAGASGERRVLDFSTGLFAAGESASFAHSGFDSMALAAVPGGGALSLYRNGTNTVADQWLPAQPTWTTTGLAGEPALSFGLRVAVNAAGKAAAIWYTTDGTGANVAIATYDGAAWSPVVTRNLPIADGAVADVELGVFANGDPLLAWAQGSATLSYVRLAVATSTFGAVVPIDTTAGATAGGVRVVVDPGDRITFAWKRGGEVYVRRDLGAGLLAPENAGNAEDYRLDLDPATSQVTLLTYKAPALSIRRLAAASETLPPAVVTGVGVSSTMTLKRDAAVVFDASGRPTVIALQSLAGAGGLGLAYATCH